MVNTTIASIVNGATIAITGGPENRIPAKGDGAAQAGQLVGYLAGTITVAEINADTVDLFQGILDKRYDTAIDTAITATKGCSIIVPTPGKLYAVHLADQGGSLSKGFPLTFGTNGNLTTAGATGLATTAPIVAYLAEDIVDDDTVAIVRWA